MTETGVLMLRTCRPGGLSHGGFRWPLEVGAIVEAPDWDPSPVCGGGLHGLPWGEGDVDLLDLSDDAVWMVVESDALVRIDDRKAKTNQATVRFVGDRQGAVDFLTADPRCAGKRVVYGTATAGDGGTATAGNGGTATAGYGGTATAGDRGTATAGYGGTATAGDRGTATAGNGGTATAGEDGVLVIQRWNGKRYRWHAAIVGEDGIEPNVAYQLDDEGRFVKVGA